MKDPFTLLSVDRTASKQQVLRQVAVALRERRCGAKQIAEAQKALFDPVARGAAEFVHFIDTPGCIGAFVPDAVRDGDRPLLDELEQQDEKGPVES